MEIRQAIIDYLTEEVSNNTTALKSYDSDQLLPNNTNQEVLRMREIEAIKLRDRIHELSRHISVIKKIFPQAEKQKPEKGEMKK